MKKLMLLVVLLFPINVFAEGGSLSVFSGPDVYYDREESYTEIRYHSGESITLFGTPFGWTAYIGDKNTLGAELFYPFKGWELGLGLEYSDIRKVVGTTYKYQLRAEYMINDWVSIGWIHKSNCRQLCDLLGLDFIPHGDNTETNSGLNFVSLRVMIFRF